MRCGAKIQRISFPNHYWGSQVALDESTSCSAVYDDLGTMSQFPDFSSHAYQVEQELGHNRAGGRVTYLAQDTRTQERVVLKQFQFAKLGSSWSDYDTYQREIQLLQALNHPGIPSYLDAFQTIDGFCMVQEYKAAVPLSRVRSFSPDDIKQIAIAALEVLIYLQTRIPSVIHRDIKPDNILVDTAGSVYLVDFGFAHIGEGEVGVSSVVKGTLGFMPPEQLFNRQLTEASDLYGLGMTLICLLTATPTDRIGDLVDISYQVSFKHLVPKLSSHWITWLEKMVEPRLKNRYSNAITALAALPASPLRPPETHFSQSSVEFRATRLGEGLTHSLTLTNPIPDTTLEGQWELVAHPHDPLENCWITVEPVTFSGNQVECQIKVATERLIPGKIYQRKLALHTNTLAKTYLLNLQVQTAASPRPAYFLSYSFLMALGLLLMGISWLVGWGVLVLGTVDGSVAATSLGTLISAALGLELAAWILRSAAWRTGPSTSTLAAVILGVAVVVKALSEPLARNSSVIFLGAVAGSLAGLIAGIALGMVSENLVLHGISRWGAIAITLLTATLGTSLGLELTLGFTNPLLLTLAVTSALTLLLLTLRMNLKQIQTAFHYQQAAKQQIKP